MPAIWTDADGAVERIFQDESELSDEKLTDAIIVDSIPDSTAKPYERPQLHYSETDGLTYTYTDELDGLPSGFTEAEKEELYWAIESSDTSSVVEILAAKLS